ncbi:MAG: stimulus-sensing domain-containing protein [Parvibaculales bacterium]
MLTRLLVINSLGLLAFLMGLLILGQTRDSLTAAYRESLRVQAYLMAEAVGGMAPESVAIMPVEAETQLMTPSINPDEASSLLNRLVAQTQTRARFYDHKGRLMVDTARPLGDVQIKELTSGDARLPEPEINAQKSARMTAWVTRLMALGAPPAPLFSDDIARQGQNLEEVRQALLGQEMSLVRRTLNHKDILTLAVPVQHYRAINGVLLVTSPPGAIDAQVQEARLTTIQLFLAILALTLILTIITARTITQPVQKLARALRQYRHSMQLPELDKIPDYQGRQDEIADLSTALRDLLTQLTQRLDAIERFASDVAHELKNPLASMHSALQTLENTDNVADRKALMDILIVDIQRLNRLISDISDASRLDAELGRKDFDVLDFSQLVRELAPVFGQDETRHVTLDMKLAKAVKIRGQSNRLAQILQNVVSNALSFAPNGSVLKITLEPTDTEAVLTIEDEGVGVAPDLVERIFERFYTDRTGQTIMPGEDIAAPQKAKRFGQHSGLGLSIAREIARVHGGDLKAHAREGGCFVLTLPLIDPASEAEITRRQKG